MALIIASDTHTGAIWDEIKKLLPKSVPFLDPNQRFKELVKVPKQHDTLILNGDLINVHDQEYLGGGSNWDIFFGMLKDCKANFLLNLGNHDYRGVEYNFTFYGLKHVNISRREQKEYLKGCFPFRWLQEVESLFFIHRATPAEYHRKRYHDETKEEVELLFLDTGTDAWNEAKHWLNPMKLFYMFRDPPAGMGLDDKELVFLKGHLAKGKKPLFLFMHFPPFFSADSFEPRKIEKGYWRGLGHLSGGTFFDNNLEFMEALIASERNITVICSHVHLPRQFMIDKKSRMLHPSTLVEINKGRKDTAKIKFLTTPGLGVIRPTYFKKVGYLRYDKKGFAYHWLKDFKKIEK